MRPESRIASIRSEVATGRKMNGRDGLMAASHAWLRSRRSLRIPRGRLATLALADGRRWLLRAAVVGLADGDAGAVPQLVGAIDNHLVARRETRLHCDPFAIGWPKADGAYGHCVVRVDQIDKGAGRATL